MLLCSIRNPSQTPVLAGRDQAESVLRPVLKKTMSPAVRPPPPQVQGKRQENNLILGHPKEGRFGTAQALQIVTSSSAAFFSSIRPSGSPLTNTTMCLMPGIFSYCACKRKNAALSGTVN